MVIPIAALDFDLARDLGNSLRVPERFRRARVLVRWQGVPLGTVEVSVCAGYVRSADVLQSLQRAHPHAVPREAVRRTLLKAGIGQRIELATVPGPSSDAISPSRRPSVSVVVCTRDRPADMLNCLAALARLSPAPLEVIIVDNAPSTDATARLAREAFPSFRYTCEPKPGLDNARNRGIAEAKGEIIAFTDDDVVVDPAWVGALAQSFADDPAIGMVTGLVEPLELETRAQILFEVYGGFGRGCRRTYSQKSRTGRMPWSLVGAGQLGAGANMAFRREVFARLGGFDPVLDVGTPTLGGGDHDIFFRALHAGYLCVYEPTAFVRHRHRRTFAELRRLLYSYGHATQCLLEREEQNFPADRPAIRKLRAWWRRHWAWQRWWRSLYRPVPFPSQLIFDEIRGYWRGRGVYKQARRRLVPDESHRPDAPHAPLTHEISHPPHAVGIFAIETSRPLSSLPEAADFDAVQICVEWRGRPIGSFRIANHGLPLSARRLADEISHQLWHPLLDPATADTTYAYLKFGADLAARDARHGETDTSAHGPLATVVLTTCNRPIELRRCLQTLTALRVQRPVQIVVVDNRPAANLAAPVVREFPGVELVTEPRQGSSYARNAGIAAARGEFVAMVDDDMHVAPDWLEKLLAPFTRADVVAVTGNTLAARLETHAERLLEVYGGFCRGFERQDFDSRWFHRWRYRAVPTWRIGGSGNVAFRREIFSWRAVGRFAETLGAGVPTGVGEDTKIFYDILHAGYTIVYEPGAVAWHYHRADMPALRKQLYAYSKGHVAYHLTTWFDHRDARAFIRIFIELPLAFVLRTRDRFRSPASSSRYPFRLLLLELAGTLAGPWSLWRAHRLAQRIRRQSKPSERPESLPLLLRKQSALESSR